MALAMRLFLHIAFIPAVVNGLRAHGQRSARIGAIMDGMDGAYTFDSFVRDFGRHYESGTEEYVHRAAIFQHSMSKIHVQNAIAERSWTAGVHPFMDWSAAERAAHGYSPSAARRHGMHAPLEALQMSGARTEGMSSGRVYGSAGDSFVADGPAVQDQNRLGQCGSCWAFASVAAVESRLMKMNSPSLPSGDPQLSVQALLDCVPRQPSCGGGCEGSSPEFAFDYMRDHGIPLEANMPYNPQELGKCTLEQYPADWVRVTLAGWRALPSNDAQAFMKALVEDGPVVVTAASSEWYEYQSGIFDGCPKDVSPDHSVLARGYGIEDGKKYWLVQNSWGTQWGEEGSIRLKRHDDLHSWCGTDQAKGAECDGTKRTDVTVCGTCGLLGYDPMVPEVGFVMMGPGPSGGEFGSAAEAEVPEDWKDRLVRGHRIKASDFDHGPPAPQGPPRNADRESTTTDAPADGEVSEFQHSKAEELLSQHSAVDIAAGQQSSDYKDTFQARGGLEGGMATSTKAPAFSSSTTSVPLDNLADLDEHDIPEGSLDGYLRR